MNEALSSALHHTNPTFVLGPLDDHSLNPCFCSPRPSSILPCLSLSCPFFPLLFECSYSSPCLSLTTCPFLLYSSLQQNALLPHIHPSLWPPPTSSHPSLSPSRVTPPSLTPSRDNYYKPCADQLVFKQLNKQRLGPLTVDIQQHLSKKLDQEIKKKNCV